MPKFGHGSSEDVSHFLELFEKVAKQNGYPESSWSLPFRVAVAGTKLEHIAAYGETYDDIKKEVLLAHGHTAEQLWRQLTKVKQGDESFRQLFWRTITKLGQFFKLAVKAESLSVDLVLVTFVKYMVLEGCSEELKEHFCWENSVLFNVRRVSRYWIVISGSARADSSLWATIVYVALFGRKLNHERMESFGRGHRGQARKNVCQG